MSQTTFGATQYPYPPRPRPGGPQPSAPLNSAQAPQQPTNSPQMPWDATYAQNMAQLGLGLNNQLAAIGAQAPGIRRSYGYDEQGNLDRNDPFSKGMQLEQAYKNRVKGNTNRYAARGQLYSGALQSAQNTAQEDWQREDAALRQQQMMALAALQAQQAEAQNAYNQQSADQSWQRLMAAQENPGYLAPAPPSSYYPASPQQPGYTSSWNGSRRR